ncbi:hypothetical protein D9M68_923810 [compost metagenome]
MPAFFQHRCQPGGQQVDHAQHHQHARDQGQAVATVGADPLQKAEGHRLHQGHGADAHDAEPDGAWNAGGGRAHRRGLALGLRKADRADQ